MAHVLSSMIITRAGTWSMIKEKSPYLETFTPALSLNQMLTQQYCHFMKFIITSAVKQDIIAANNYC